MAKVLILEDEPSIAGIAAHKLRREGHEVRCAERLDAAEAGCWSPTLVVLDLDAEGGWRMLDELTPAMRVLTLTGFGDEGAAPRATAAGATATLAKPFKPTVLARVVRELTAAPE